MSTRTWFITGINSGFGRELTEQLLRRGDRVAGTVRAPGSVDDLSAAFGGQLWLGLLDVTDTPAVKAVVADAFEAMGPIDVVVNNAGYGLFGAAEEVSDDQIEHIIGTNLIGSIQVARAALPHLRDQGQGRIIQISSVAGQSAHAGASLYHASKWGIEGFMEALAQEVAPFGIGVTIIEPGGARTEFAGASIRLGTPLDAYDGTPAAMVRLIGSPQFPASIGDPAAVAAAVIACAEVEPAPLRVVLGSDSFMAIEAALTARLEAHRSQRDSAAATDDPVSS